METGSLALRPKGRVRNAFPQHSAPTTFDYEWLAVDGGKLEQGCCQCSALNVEQRPVRP